MAIACGATGPLDELGRSIGRTIRRNVGIPVSIGIAPTFHLDQNIGPGHGSHAACKQENNRLLHRLPFQLIWFKVLMRSCFSSSASVSGVVIRTRKGSPGNRSK